ncbi:MAG: ATP-dependent Clp protease adaptor ClpS [Planctomycetota bacterium]
MDDQESIGGDVGAAVVVRPKRAPAPQRRLVPRWNVVLWDDDQHSYAYVIFMLRDLFGHNEETGFRLAEKVDTEGRAVVLTTTQEHAELKRDQILGYGEVASASSSEGSMHATIERVEEDSSDGGRSSGRGSSPGGGPASDPA